MLKNIKSVYIIGIGGISMSALALMLKDRGIIVKGSDLHLSELTDKLTKQGIEIVEGEAPQFVERCDAVVYTGAISEDNNDIKLAQRLGRVIYSRAQLLGFFSREKKTISIAGTHGKTTTTAMISTILLEAGLDPTIHIGGNLKTINSNLHIGKSDLFVTEACEYQDAFLSLSNYISVVLNVEEDHLDYFNNFENICTSFNKFIEKTRKNGVIIYNFDNCKDILKINNQKAISFGFGDQADLRAVKVEEYQKGRYSFDAVFKGEKLGRFSLSCIGQHNVYNALASIAVCLSLGVGVEQIAKGLANFQGVGRRMDIIQEEPIIIHDYAHHPHEIQASLKAINALSDDKLICIFQPHTFSRTKALYEQFLSCFDLCDEVWLLPIYPARERAIKGITSKKLRDDLIKKGIYSRHFSTFDSCKKEICKKKYENYSFAILGAGDIEKLAKMLR